MGSKGTSFTLDLLDKVNVRKFVEKECGVYRFEDFTTLRKETLVNLYLAVMGEQRSIEDLKKSVFYNVKINVHRKEKKTSEQIYDSWTKSQCIIFHEIFSKRELFSMDIFFPGFYEQLESKLEFTGQYRTPLDIFFDYRVDGFY